MTHSEPRTESAPANAPGYEPASRSDPFSLLVAEHALLRQQFARTFLALQRGDDPAIMRAALSALAESLRLHQGREEAVLYPVCERLFDGEAGAASVLREDHTALARHLAALMRTSGSAGRISRLRLDALRNEADEHFGREERVLFPMTAALLSGTESGDLARRLRTVVPPHGEG